MAVWAHSDSIPNSVVKRARGEDTLGVAPRENSSVPGLYYKSKPPLIINPMGGVFGLIDQCNLKLRASKSRNWPRIIALEPVLVGRFP